MKKFSLIMLCCAFLGSAQAQLPDGSIAPDFSLYEIDKTNGNILTDHAYTLYEYTDAGKAVFLDFFANWCGPCWTYHSSGTFENLYNQYGPNGTNEVMVMGIEGDNGNYANLTSPRNWLAGVPYPIIPTNMSPNTASVVNNYSIGYFPTIYMVCPNRQIYEVGRESTENLYAAISSTCPSYEAGLMNNAIIVSGSNINNVYFCNAEATPKILLQNVGQQNITSVKFTIDYDGQTSVYNWTGNLSKFASETITLPAITTNTAGIHNYSITIDQVNGVADADSVGNEYVKEFNVQVEGTTELIDESFSNTSFLNNWVMTNDLLYLYQGHLYFNAYELNDGTTEELYLPLLDITGISTPVLKFDVAHARYNSSTKERLKVRVSTDCGSTWTNVYNKVDPDLATANPTNDVFIPNSNQWRTETVDLSNYKTNQTIVKFVFTSGYGNLIWLDNVKILDGTGIEDYSNNPDFKIYPNPVTSTLHIQSSDPVKKVEVYNLAGQRVKAVSATGSISIRDLPNGMYILHVTTDKGVSNHKITKE